MELNHIDIEARIQQARRLRSEALGEMFADGIIYCAAHLTQAASAARSWLKHHVAVNVHHAAS